MRGLSFRMFYSVQFRDSVNPLSTVGVYFSFLISGARKQRNISLRKFFKIWNGLHVFFFFLLTLSSTV